ncbi:hypothetical protein TSUD_392470 [Trifolium subterraneum]|uniref:Uncharacterized protein n=1 Tax=Trifolium subterraneum TaxID=3900 RepID=A0A2Z6ME04_TRISU|nr:hypothetical protein TSUD_392470 [Trifolium subterraneum]
MSMESDSTVLHGVTGPNSGPKPQRKWKRLKRRAYEYEPPIRRDYEFEPPIRREPLRKELQSKVSQKVYVCNVFDNSLETYTKLVISNPYDATPPPPGLVLYGGDPFSPLVITDEYRPLLTKLSHLALDYYNYNINKGIIFEFHDLVKCIFRQDCRSKTVVTCGRDPTEFYITFQAKPIGKAPSSSPAITDVQAKDPSSSPAAITGYQFQAKGPSSSPAAITVFQAKVLVSVNKDDEDKPPVVEECRIKI